MTTTYTYLAARSANDRFKLHYPRYLRGAVLAALALTAVFVWLFPRYEPRPYQLRQKELVITDIEVIPEIILPQVKLPPVLPPPIVEAVPDDGPVEDPGKWSSRLLPDPVVPAPIANDTPFVVSSAKPILLARAKADYPELARRSGLEGTVLVHVLVGVHGRVMRAEIAQSVHPLLDRAALQAARKCRFKPAQQREIKVKAWLAIPYRFRLR